MLARSFSCDPDENAMSNGGVRQLVHSLVAVQKSASRKSGVAQHSLGLVASNAVAFTNRQICTHESVGQPRSGSCLETLSQVGHALEPKPVSLAVTSAILKLDILGS